MPDIIEILLSAYCALFVVSVFKEDNSVADIFWGLGFILISVSLFVLEQNQSYLHMLVLALVSIWGVRLFSLFILRKMRHNVEDPRYAVWRKQWTFFYLRSFFQVYILQMFLMLVVSTPLFLIFSANTLHPVATIVGSIIAIFGLTFEIIADKQIVAFIKTKKMGENKVYTKGLWKFSRNPNYFGESVFWLGISIISLPVSYFGMIGYITITILLLFVSGVPLKELRQAKKDNWASYKAKTNKFIPWVPKK